ncbi:MAG: ATP-binding protein [Chlorobi bacterium]|nr:ATP-binding protein [Chlorobiota bacterium]
MYDVGYNNIYLIENYGYRFENIILNHLKQKYKSVFYLKQNNYEVDFIVEELDLAIQVCYELNEENFEREIN